MEVPSAVSSNVQLAKVSRKRKQHSPQKVVVRPEGAVDAVHNLDSLAGSDGSASNGDQGFRYMLNIPSAEKIATLVNWEEMIVSAGPSAVEKPGGSVRDAHIEEHVEDSLPQALDMPVLNLDDFGWTEAQPQAFLDDGDAELHLFLPDFVDGGRDSVTDTEDLDRFLEAFVQYVVSLCDVYFSIYLKKGGLRAMN